MSTRHDRAPLGAGEAIVLVAAMVRRDLGRNVGAWRLPLFTSGLLALLFLGAALGTVQMQQRLEQTQYPTAVTGDIFGARSLLTGIDDGPLAVRFSSDAVADVRARSATVGLVIPDDLDRRVERGDEMTLVVLRREANHNSMHGSSRLVAQIHRVWGDPVDRLAVAETDVADDPAASRDSFSRTAAGFSAFLLLGVVTSTAGLLGRTRERRGAEPLLVLPVPRVAIAAGVALGALPLAVAYVAMGFVVLLGAALLPLPTLGLPLTMLTGAVGWAAVVAAVLAALGVGLGALAGSVGGGSEDSVGVGDLLTMPVLALGLTLLVAPTLPTTATTVAIPGLGPMVVLRDALLGEASVGALLVATLTTLTAVAGLLAVTGRLLGNERVVQRV